MKVLLCPCEMIMSHNTRPQAPAKSCAKKYPDDIDQETGDQRQYKPWAPAFPEGAATKMLCQPALRREETAVQGPPGHEGPGSTMPQTAQHHRGHQVGVGAQVGFF